MGEVVQLPSQIETLVTKIRGHVFDAGKAENTCIKHRHLAGLDLIALRSLVEGDGGDWWRFFDEQFNGHIKSRKYAERLMRWARSDDPEAAIEAERAKVRDAVQKHRERKSKAGTYVSAQEEPGEREDYDIVDRALGLVAKMSDEERDRFDAAYREQYQ